LDGDVKLKEFSIAIHEFFNLVNSLGRDCAPKKNIDWLIINLEASSAITTIQGKPLTNTNIEDVEKVVDDCLEVGRKIQKGLPLDYSESVNKAANRLVRVIDGNITSIRFENNEFDVEIYNRPQDYSNVAGERIPEGVLGAVRGKVTSLQQRGQLRFTIYDLVDDKAISCYLIPGNEEIMREAWGKITVVEGVVHRNPLTGRPTSIRQIKNIKILSKYKPGEWREAIGCAPGFLGNDLPEDVIRKARDV